MVFFIAALVNRITLLPRSLGTQNRENLNGTKSEVGFQQANGKR
jgi:hypothetical protein